MQICNNFFVNHEQNNLELFLTHKFRVKDTRVDSLPGEGYGISMGHEYSFLKYLNKSIQKRVILEGGNVSLENSGHQLMCI